jgi:hypothetical protein
LYFTKPVNRSLHDKSLPKTLVNSIHHILFFGPHQLFRLRPSQMIEQTTNMLLSSATQEFQFWNVLEFDAENPSSENKATRFRQAGHMADGNRFRQKPALKYTAAIGSNLSFPQFWQKGGKLLK